MKQIKQISALILLLFVAPIFSQDIKPEEVKKIMKKVADWEIQHHDDLAIELKIRDYQEVSITC